MAIRDEGDDGGRTLLAWNAAEPPTRSRRAATTIHTAWQHNRDPFIDHPEWASAIFD